MRNAPIGIFDSGVGGITVARAVLDQLPGESINYIGDSVNLPYGSKPIALVRKIALQVMDTLVESGVKILVIACNTASAAVLRDARERYTHTIGLPVVEVIIPAVRRALTVTRNNKVGVISTQATMESGAYQDAFAVAPQIDLQVQACPQFVDFVERGDGTSRELLEVADHYLSPIRAVGVDTLVLGCTHYPLLTGAISYIMGPEVTLVSSAEETAKDVYRALVAKNLLADPGQEPLRQFATTGDKDEFSRLAYRFLGSMVGNVVEASALARGNCRS